MINMIFIDFVIISVSILITFFYIRGFRLYIKAGREVHITSINTIQILFLLIILVILGLIPALNLLWMIPLTWFFGMISHFFPFSIISSIIWHTSGKYLARLLSSGIKMVKN